MSLLTLYVSCSKSQCILTDFIAASPTSTTTYPRLPRLPRITASTKAPMSTSTTIPCARAVASRLPTMQALRTKMPLLAVSLIRPVIRIM